MLNRVFAGSVVNCRAALVTLNVIRRSKEKRFSATASRLHGYTVNEMLDGSIGA